MKWHFLCLCSFHTRLYKSAILPILPPPPVKTHRDPGSLCPFRPAPDPRGFPQGKKTSGRKLRHLFSTVSGAQLEQGTGYSPILLSPGKIPNTLCSHLSTCNNPWALGQGATVPVPGQTLRDYSGLSAQGWHETGGPGVEAMAMGSLWGKGSQSYRYFPGSV